MEIYLKELDGEVAAPREDDYEVNPQGGQEARAPYRKPPFRGAVPAERGFTPTATCFTSTLRRGNKGNVPFDVDFVTFKIVDKKVVKRTAMQEQVIYPLRAYNYTTRVDGGKAERTVFALPKFTIPDGKMLVVEMNEKQGGRHQRFEVQGEDVANAETIDEVRVL